MATYKTRTLERSLKKMINVYPVIMVTGPRQVGKTTILNHLKANSKQKINFVSLDDMKLRSQANEDPELFLNTFETPLIIDEFQYAPNLLSYIKIAVDKAREDSLFGSGKKVPTLYYLTGSQIFQTMEGVCESLAGRIGILDMHAFSTRELNEKNEDVFIPDINILKKKTPVETLKVGKLYERILKGSYPEIYNNKNYDIEKFYEIYVRTYMERDIRQIINVKDENKFMKFISSIAARTAQEYNASNIAEDVGIDVKTAQEWLSILKNTGLVFLLQPFTNNNVGRIIKRPKLYFMDTGLACYLTGYSDAKILEKSAYNGAIFETYVVTEIIKSFTNNGKDPRKHLYYYRDSNQKEIDLVITNNDKAYPVEIKKSTNPGKAAVKNFGVLTKSKMTIPNGIVLCMADRISAIDEFNYIVPIEYI